MSPGVPRARGRRCPACAAIRGARRTLSRWRNPLKRERTPRGGRGMEPPQPSEGPNSNPAHRSRRIAGRPIGGQRHCSASALLGKNGTFEQGIDPAHRYRKVENDESKEKTSKGGAETTVRAIRRKTRRRYAAEEKFGLCCKGFPARKALRSCAGASRSTRTLLSLVEGVPGGGQ